MADPHTSPGHTSPKHPSPQRGHVHGWQQFLGLIGAPILWMGQISFDFVLADFACRPLHGIGPWIIAAGAASIAGGAVCGWIAYGAWKQTQGEAGGGQQRAINIGEGRSRFFAITGMLSSGIFTAASLFTLLAALMVRPC